MLRLFGGDLCLVTWIQKLFGLYLTGEKYSKMVCFSGDGGNGKSVLSRWLGKLLGDFAQMNCPKALARAANELEGRRLAVCDEVGQGLCLNDEKFKQITGGGDTMAARRLHQDSRTIDTSQGKLLALANSPFYEVSSSEAFRRRLAVVAMPCRFSFVASEVDDKVFLAQEPAELDAMLDSSAEDFFARAPSGTILRGLLTSLQRSSRRLPPSFLKKTLCCSSSIKLQSSTLGAWKMVSLMDLAELWAEEGFGRDFHLGV
ncbi:hypothetical protein TL16_g10463 [Triparma laevis f. inornata]|uniref:SF3 helicase domain-containing protein n=2 Tax=Triparma laevis TaxID=1534972 RepID=A0A9W7FHL2_9STRA|nr:hypothetical protein TL16_g10463 [Triparma laevis f. inornata]GMI12176.1 hypothetical protein TrLO_g9778 [Triparma laevis f. longispina]